MPLKNPILCSNNSTKLKNSLKIIICNIILNKRTKKICLNYLNIYVTNISPDRCASAAAFVWYNKGKNKIHYKNNMKKQNK